MSVASNGHGESARLAAIRDYRLDRPVRGTELGEIVRLAAEICGTPAAQANVIAAEQQLTKAWFGLEGDVAVREDSFCSHTIEQPEGLLVVEDACKDARFATNPFVTEEPSIRFYAGSALRSADGLPLGALCVIDYEPRRLAPAQLEMLRRLAQIAESQLELHRLLETERRLNELRDEFVVSTAHDFRNPLSVITGYASLLARGHSTLEPDKALAAIEEAALRIGRMIDNYLAVAQIGERGELPLEPAPVELAPMVHGIVEAFSPFAALAQVDLRAHAPIDVAAEIDRFRLTQALENLLTNALKFTPPGRRVTLELARDGDQALIRVRDTGIGISDDDSRRLSERFFRADSARTHGVKGTGLGLMAVRRIARAHGGELEVDSREGNGSVFTLRLPLRQPASPPSDRAVRTA